MEIFRGISKLLNHHPFGGPIGRVRDDLGAISWSFGGVYPNKTPLGEGMAHHALEDGKTEAQG